MFADSLLDSASPSRSRLGWSTLASFAVQAVCVGSLLLLPMLFTSGLPQLALNEPLLARVPSSGPPSTAHVRATNSAGDRRQAVSIVVAPQSVPHTLKPGGEVAVPSAPDLDNAGVSAGSGDRASGNGVRYGLGSGFNAAVPPPPPPIARQPRVSRMMEGNLIYRVQPDYPALAKLARIQGAVLLRAVISKQGTIENLQPVSGPPLLIRAALDAVRQWRYRPYLLNGEPVQVDTQITVNFVLTAG